MFASNQILEISGCIEHEGDLADALEFVLKKDNHMECFTRKEKPSKCVWQITEDGRYCLGWAFEGIKEGWNEYPFDFDVKIIAQIIEQFLNKQEIKYDMWAGSYRKGFLMKNIDETMAIEDDGIKNPFYGIVQFLPYTCFYSK